MGVFSVAVKNWKGATEEKIEKTLKLATIELFEQVIANTPVDTGFLRSTWRVSLTDLQQLKDVNPYPSQKKQGLGPILTNVDPYIPIIENVKLGQTIFCSYSAEYAGFQEYGSQGRAPVGMVRLATQNWLSIVQDASNKVK